MALALVLTGCALDRSEGPVHRVAPGQSAPERGDLVRARYLCDHDIAFNVRFGDGAATLDVGSRGTETLMRDAGGTSPRQTVYSSTGLKAEFGLDPDGRGAVLRYAEPALEVHCERQAP